MNVLLVDGSISDAAALERLLQSLGNEVCVCHRGDAALEWQNRFSPDLVIIDANLPEMSWLALVHELQRRNVSGWQPIILISADFNASVLTSAMAAGCDACFPKPVDIPALEMRLDILSRQLRTHRDAETHLARIRELLAAEEADLNIARHLIEHQLIPDGVRRHDDPAVQYWRLSCARLGGTCSR